ncbi:MAG: hypothetical protein NTX64_00075 [Elusimicrobia bacterium]|nr:hypothetical protein [Elusimicrobiota bacterium]
MEPGTWKLIPYYQGTKAQDLKFTLSSNGTCTGGGTYNPAFVCNTNGNVKVHATGGLGMVKLLAQPWEAVQYYVAGGLGNMSLDIPGSGIATTQRTGFALVGGARAVVIPDTIVGPALTLDLSYGLQRYRLDALGPTAIDQQLDMRQAQVAIETSHRFDFKDPKTSVEPYGGVKWLRTWSSLTDNQAGGRAGGIQDAFTPFAGLQVSVYEHESLFAEASFVDGVQYAAGAHIRFR